MASMRLCGWIERRVVDRRCCEAQAVRVVVGVRVAAAHVVRGRREARRRREAVDDSGALSGAQRLAAIAAAALGVAVHTRQAAPAAVALSAETRAQVSARRQERRAQRLEHEAHLPPEIAAGHTVQPEVQRVVRVAQHLRAPHECPVRVFTVEYCVLF